MPRPQAGADGGGPSGNKPYVPGYGYVDPNDPGTSGSVYDTPYEQKPYDSGQSTPEAPIIIARPAIPIVPTLPDAPTFQVNFEAGLGVLGNAIDAVSSSVSDTVNRSLDSWSSGDNNFRTEDLAQQVADINDGVVVRESDGTYSVKYGIYAQQATAQQAAERRAEESRRLARIREEQFAVEDTTTNAPSNYQNLPYDDPSSDSFMGRLPEMFGLDPLLYAAQYKITTATNNAVGDRTPLMNYSQLEDLRQSNDPTGFLVYMGEVTTAGSTGAVIAENYQDARYVSNYLNLTPEQRQQVYDMVNRFYPKYWEPSYIQGLWEKAVKSASEGLLVEGKKQSPWGAFEESIAAAAAADAERNASSGGYGGYGYGGYGGGYGGGGGGATRTTIVLTSPTDAWVILNQAMTQYFGRQASQEELSKFVKALNAMERANPVEQTVSADGTSTTQEGGFNPQSFAQQFVQGKEGSAEYMAATTFLDAFLGMVEKNNGVL